MEPFIYFFFHTFIYLFIYLRVWSHLALGRFASDLFPLSDGMGFVPLKGCTRAVPMLLPFWGDRHLPCPCRGHPESGIASLRWYLRC